MLIGDQDQPLPFDETVAALRAAAEPTRLRILAVLSSIDLTVSELCTVLAQTQPRVSRHLKLLVDAGLLVRHSEGTRAYYRPPAVDRRSPTYDAVVSLINPDDPALGRDRARLESVRAERAATAAEYFGRIAEEWDRVRDLFVSDTEVEQALLDAVADHATRDLLDIGTGTGRILEVFADQVRKGIGIDLSPEMLNVARANLDRAGLRHCSVRRGDVYDLDVPDGSMDVAVLHHVLHFLDDPSTAVAEAARTLRSNGSLLIVDFAPHGLEQFRSDYEHRFLGFADDEVERWCGDAGLIDVEIQHLHPGGPARRRERTGLVTTVWVARQRADAPDLHHLEVAS